MTEMRQITVNKSGQVKVSRTVNIDENLIRQVNSFLQELISDTIDELGLEKNVNISNRSGALKNRIWGCAIKSIANTDSEGGSFLRDLFLAETNKPVYQSFRKVYINIFEVSKNWYKSVESMARQIVHYTATSRLKENHAIYARHGDPAEPLKDSASQKSKIRGRKKRANSILRELRTRSVSTQKHLARKRARTNGYPGAAGAPEIEKTMPQKVEVKAAAAARAAEGEKAAAEGVRAVRALRGVRK